MSTHTQTIVIVGARLTGAKAAEMLREEGFDGRIVLIGDESERPYERPPLTKDYLRGESPRGQAYVHSEAFYREHGIELMTGTAVTALHPAHSRVTLDDGRELAYDWLLLATGAEPRRISIAGAELSGVHHLRTLADYDALRERLDPVGRVVVVGAGWIGAEFAASARQRGAEVTVIQPGSVPLERVPGADVGAIYRDLAEAAGLRTDNGIVVDQALVTDAPNVYAAGDVANAWHPFYARYIRVEHWANALHQGPAAARAMLGQKVAYDRIPYFFSDQYDVAIEYSGFATEWDDVVFRGDPASREFIAFWLQNERVVAGMNVNVWDVNEHVQALIRSRQAVNPAALADTDTPLDALVDNHESSIQA
jgi:3-phenylpropionate/trans-cinnamate dioxygenase ferredoxin reductase component